MQRIHTLSSLVVLALVLCSCNCASTACTSCETSCSSAQVAAPAALPTKLLGRADVDVGGKCIGSVRTLQGEGADSTTVTSVLDVHGDMMGFVTADGTAFRGSGKAIQRVGQSNDLRALAALILSVPSGQRTTLTGVHGKLIPGFPGHL
ncbi:MAG: hypothetical protein EXS14_00360 [Planctomycetes bacterium]|nr:hypothetical protein [Planctomycetota bacterium]